MVAEADHRCQWSISAREVAQHRQCLGLRKCGRQCQRFSAADRPRQRLIDELLQVGQAERGQHLLAVIDLRADVTRAEPLRR